MKDNHSEKGLKTLEVMGTTADDWGLTPIKWVWEMIVAPVEKVCPSCHGRGQTNSYPDGKVFDYQKVTKALKKKAKSSYVGHYELEDYKKKNGVKYGRCPKCPQKKTRNWGPIDVGTGKVIVWEKVKMLVGYPIWPKGCLFDSRFHEAKYYRQGKTAGKYGEASVHSVCELCSKSIYGRWSFLVPVNGKGKDGKTHGMYVGEDCAHKFLGLELVLDLKQLEEVKKSERKQRVQIRITKGSK